ncbi:MAG: ribbon-helix-helix protein, CopG family [Cellvibrio sp.]
MSVTTVRLQPELEQSLVAMSNTMNRSKSWLINQALKEFVERQTLEQERWRQTLEAMESVAKGQVVAAEDVHNWLETWGTDNELLAPKAAK